MSTADGSTTEARVSTVTGTKRIALVHLMQETNTFNPVPTTLADFESVAPCSSGTRCSRGSDPSGPIAGTYAAVRGERPGRRTIPVLRADAQSGGRLSRENARRAVPPTHAPPAASLLPVDGLLVLLHGAAAADGVDDVEGHVLAIIRSAAGRRSRCG